MYNFSTVRQTALLLTAVLSGSSSVCPSVRHTPISHAWTVWDIEMHFALHDMMFLYSFLKSFLVLSWRSPRTSMLKRGIPIESANLTIICNNLERVQQLDEM